MLTNDVTMYILINIFPSLRDISKVFCIIKFIHLVKLWMHIHVCIKYMSTYHGLLSTIRTQTLSVVQIVTKKTSRTKQNSFVYSLMIMITSCLRHEQNAWHSGSVMDCHTMTLGSIPGGNSVFTKLHILCKGQ